MCQGSKKLHWIIGRFENSNSTIYLTNSYLGQSPISFIPLSFTPNSLCKAANRVNRRSNNLTHSFRQKTVYYLIYHNLMLVHCFQHKACSMKWHAVLVTQYHRLLPGIFSGCVLDQDTSESQMLLSRAN